MCLSKVWLVDMERIAKHICDTDHTFELELNTIQTRTSLVDLMSNKNKITPLCETLINL